MWSEFALCETIFQSKDPRVIQKMVKKQAHVHNKF